MISDQSRFTCPSCRTKLVRIAIEGVVVYTPADAYSLSEPEVKSLVEGMRQKLLEASGTRKELFWVGKYTQEVVDRARVEEAPDLEYVVVAVVPARKDAETGIVVAGATEDDQFYVLADCSLAGTAYDCALRILGAYRKYRASGVVAIVNEVGGYLDLALNRISADCCRSDEDPEVRFKGVRVTEPLEARMQPAGALYDQGRVHHVGELAGLEEQMCHWLPGIPERNGRVAALILALAELHLGEENP